MIKYFNIQYIGGHPQLEKPTLIELQINIETNQVILIEKLYWKTRTEIIIDSADIISTSIDTEESGRRLVGKAAKGAIVDSIELIAGSAIGTGKKDSSKLYITINYKGRETCVILKTKAKTQEIYTEISSFFNLKYSFIKGEDFMLHLRQRLEYEKYMQN
jgi:hypothetical protein